MDRPRQWLAWTTSVLVHLGLLGLGAMVLMRAPHFTVVTGQTEIDLMPLPAPVREKIAPPPSLLPPAVFPPATAPVFPLSTLPEALPVLPRRYQPQHPPAFRPARPVTAPAAPSSKGAIKAQPDDLHNEPPAYPENARAAREQGLVMLRVSISASGNPESVSIFHSSGFFVLDQAARRAVQHWRFHPGVVAGSVVASELDVPIRFRLQ